MTHQLVLSLDEFPAADAATQAGFEDCVAEREAIFANLEAIFGLPALAEVADQSSPIMVLVDRLGLDWMDNPFLHEAMHQRVLLDRLDDPIRRDRVLVIDEPPIDLGALLARHDKKMILAEPPQHLQEKGWWNQFDRKKRW